MILDSLFRIAAFEFKKENKLPRHVYIRRHKFRHEYHIREVVALASKVCGLSHSVGISNQMSALGIIKKAARLLHDERLLSPVCGFVISDLPKTKLNGAVKIIDLRDAYCNVYGLARVRLCAAATDTARDIVLRPEHRYAAVAAAQGADIIIVETSTQSAHLQHFLARANVSTVVTTTSEVADYYTGVDTSDEWSTSMIATA